MIGKSLGERVCGGDKSLHLSGIQMSLYDEIRTGGTFFFVRYQRWLGEPKVFAPIGRICGRIPKDSRPFSTGKACVSRRPDPGSWEGLQMAFLSCENERDMDVDGVFILRE